MTPEQRDAHAKGLRIRRRTVSEARDVVRNRAIQAEATAKKAREDEQRHEDELAGIDATLAYLGERRIA